MYGILSKIGFFDPKTRELSSATRQNVSRGVEIGGGRGPEFFKIFFFRP